MNPRNFLLSSLLLPLSFLSSVAHADFVTNWNTTALHAIQLDRTPPRARPARSAIRVDFSTPATASRKLRPYFRRRQNPPASLDERRHRRRRARVHAHFFPAQSAAFDDTFAAQLGRAGRRPGQKSRPRLGETVAAISNSAPTMAPMSRRLHAGPAVPGVWVPTPPVAPALLPQWRSSRRSR